jgi:hypothetical protein
MKNTVFSILLMMFANLSVCELKAGEGQKLVQQNNVTSSNTVLTTQRQYSRQATVIESPKRKKKKRGNGDKIIQGILVIGILLMLTFGGKQ